VIEYKGLINMTVRVKFISLPNLSRKEMKIEIQNRENIRLDKFLDIVSEEVGVDFTVKKDSYLFMHDSIVVSMENSDRVNLRDLDTVTIMPMLCGG